MTPEQEKKMLYLALVYATANINDLIDAFADYDEDGEETGKLNCDCKAIDIPRSSDWNFLLAKYS